MSDQLFERAVRDWLEDGSDRTPSKAVEAVLLAVQTTPQERDLRIPRRLTLMTPNMRLAAGIAIVALAGVTAFTLMDRIPGIGGPGPSPTPTAAPTPTPAPTQTVIDAGTITLTDSGCSWADNPGSVQKSELPMNVTFTVVNETDTFGNFGIYRLDDGVDWSVGADYIAAVNAALHGKATHPPAADFVTEVGSIDAPGRRQYQSQESLADAGRYGVVCSSNEPPPGLVFTSFLVGPLDVTVR